MGDRVVLWSGEGRYVAEKDVATASIEATDPQIRVDWGDRVDLLSGETWTITTGTWRVFSFRNSCSGTCQTYHSVAYLLKSPYSWSSGSSVNSLCGGVRSFPRVTDGVNTYNLRTSRPVTGGNSTLCANGASLSQQLPRVKFPGTAGNSNGVMTPQEIESFLEKTVQTNTGAISKKDTSIDPTVTLLSSDSCSILVTFTDSTTLTIPLTYCPSWVTVVPDKQCPPDTCHECEHDGLKCCYSLGQDGLFHLIDSFHT